MSEFEMAVGDLESAEKGTGARANGGKVRMDLIPLQITLRTVRRYLHSPQMTVLDHVAAFERGDDSGIYRAAHYLSPDDLREAARVFEYGATKYAAWNWLKGMPWSVPLGCIGRHLLELPDDKPDVDSGYSHWGHIVCNIIMLRAYAEWYREGDDRPPKELFNE